jgi:hypothetical protein
MAIAFFLFGTANEQAVMRCLEWFRHFRFVFFQVQSGNCFFQLRSGQVALHDVTAISGFVAMTSLATDRIRNRYFLDGLSAFAKHAYV